VIAISAKYILTTHK